MTENLVYDLKVIKTDVIPLAIRRQWFRLNEISRCMDYLSCLRDIRKDCITFNDHHNLIWGELDWLDELHRLLYSPEFT